MSKPAPRPNQSTFGHLASHIVAQGLFLLAQKAHREGDVYKAGSAVYLLGDIYPKLADRMKDCEDWRDLDFSFELLFSENPEISPAPGVIAQYDSAIHG